MVKWTERSAAQKRREKETTDDLVKMAEFVLKNDCLEFMDEIHNRFLEKKSFNL